MTRCPSCGRRVTTSCPVHGAVDVPGTEPDSSQVSGPSNPTFEGYRILRMIGIGGFGTVFEAEPLAPEGERSAARVAIKLPRPDRPDARLCLTHETQVLEAVGPPHVPAVLGRGALGDGTPYLVMEYLVEPTLADLFLARTVTMGGAPPNAQLAAMPIEEACALTLALLDALEPVHDRGYVHCDLKPENIFVTSGPSARRVTLVDFGLGAAMEGAGRSRESTIGGAGVGTAEYMSPEQCEGRVDIDARADLYAVGVILFELCAGYPPFWGARTVVREAHLSRRPPRLSTVAGGGGRQVPRALDEIVARCLAKDRRDRYPAVPALRAALAAAREEAGAPAQRPTMRSPAPAPAPARGEARAGGAAGPHRDHVPVGLLFFATSADVVTVQARLLALGGHLAHAGGGRVVAAFGQDTGDNPARRALHAGEELLRQGLAQRVRVDLAPVAVHTRKDGSKRFMSPLFTQEGRFPDGRAPAGISLTAEAAAVLPDAAPAGQTPAAGIAGLPLYRAVPVRATVEADPTAEMAGWPMIGRDAVLDALVESARRTADETIPATASVIGEPGEGKSHLFRVLVKRLGETGLGEVLALRAREPALGDADRTVAELLQRVLDLPVEAPPDGGRELLRERLGTGGRGPRSRHAPGWHEERRRSQAPAAGSVAPPSFTTPPGSTTPGRSAPIPLGAAAGDPRSASGRAPTLRPPPTFAPPSAPTSPPESRAPSSGADLGPAVALALGWVVPDAPDSAMRPELKALGAAPGALRSALTVAAGEALRRRAAERPLFVVIDDAHYASDVLVSALEYAALSESGARLWICVLGRPAFEQLAPTWGERAGRRERHRLGPLDEQSATTLCRRLLLPVESVADSAIRRLTDRAQNVPLLLVELVRGLRREGIVRRSPKGEAWYLATDELDRLPDLPLIEWLARSELDALAPTLRGHVRLLALLGERVAHADVAGVLLRLEQEGGDLEFPLDGRVATQRLLATGVVIEDRDARIGFRHALVREAIARGTPEALRRRIHHAAALHYLDAPAADRDDGAREPPAPAGADEQRLAKLAYHAAEAGMGVVAERAYLELAGRARARHAYTDAERLYSRALEQRGEASPVERAAAYRGRGLMRSRIGRHHDALTDFSCARTMAEEQGDVEAQIEILLDEATAFDWLNEFKSSEDRVEQAQALAREHISKPLSARILLGRGRAAHRFSRNEDAAALFEHALAEAEPLGDDAYETRVICLLLLGFIYLGLSRSDDAQRAFDETIALCEAHGDRVHLAAALLNRAPLWSHVGDKDRMAMDTERALSLAREFGQTTLELIGEFNLGETLLVLDDPEGAEPHIQRAIEIDRRLSGAEMRPAVALLHAKLHFYRAETPRVREILQRVRARELDAQARGEVDALLVPTEEILCSMLDLATGEANDEAWDELEARARRYATGYEEIEVIETRAVWEERRGCTAEARRNLERALEMAVHVRSALGPRLGRRLRELGSTE